MRRLVRRISFRAQRSRHPLPLALASFLILLFAGTANACLSGEHARLSVHCEAEPFYERMLKVVFGDLAEPRQIAVIAGVSEYPNLSALQQLPPVDHDIEMLTNMTTERLRFDEVIVLKNEDFNAVNLRHIFRVYLPDVLIDNPKSRVLFAFSGHGANLGESGYLFLSNTATISPQRHADVDNAIGLDELAGFLGPTVDQAQHFLALINACKGGGFLSFAHVFGEDDATGLQEPGAQAITAGGANDLVHAYESLGEGSVFFEMVEQAFSGRSIRLGEEQFDDPSRGSGILTATDLADYLIDTISVIEDHRQSPRFGSLTGHDRGRQGEFFFIIDEEQARETFARDFPEGMRRVFGAIETDAEDAGASNIGGDGAADAVEHETAAAADLTSPDDLSPLAGRWVGTYEVPGFIMAPPPTIEIELTADCAMNRVCGWIAVPNVPCRGRLTLVDSREAGFEFHVDQFDASSDMSVCTPGAGEVLKPLEDGALSYTATYSGAVGILRRAN